MLLGAFVGLTALTTGCKKETVQQPATQTPSGSHSLQNLGREYSASEIDKIVADAQTFQQYANDLRESKTLNAGDLAASYLPEDAVFLLESTTNYYYGRPNHFRPSDTTAGFSNAAVLSGEQISLDELAKTYNTFRSQFKSFYEGISGDEKSFGFTDFEYDTDAKMLTATAIISFGTEDASLLYWRTKTTPDTFSGTASYDWVGSSTGCSSSLNGVYLLSRYVKQNIDVYNNPNPYSNPGIAVNITNIKNMYINNPTSPGPLKTLTSNANPWSFLDPSVQKYNRLYSSTRNTVGQHSASCIPTYAMNYYRKEQVEMLKEDQILLNKTCVYYKLIPMTPTNMGGGPFFHSIESAQFASMAKIQVLPYATF